MTATCCSYNHDSMGKTAAIAALAALAQGCRMDIFRLLVCHGPRGLPAGEIAERLGVQPATLSFHLTQLSQAGLVTSRRQGRSIIYSAAVQTMTDVVSFLLQNCCSGNPDPNGAAGDKAPAARPMWSLEPAARGGRKAGGEQSVKDHPIEGNEHGPV